MKLKTYFSELKFGQNENSYFKNFHYTPADPEEARFGELFLTIEILNNPGGAEVVASEVFAKLRETYYSYLGNDDYSSFESALREVNGTLRDLAERSEQKWLGKINAVAAVRSEQNLHLAQTGAAEAYLLRAGKAVRISETLAESEATTEERTLSTFTSISSGELASQDQLILTTEHLLRVISQDELERIFLRDRGLSFMADLREKLVLEPGQTMGLGFLMVTHDESAADTEFAADPENSNAEFLGQRPRRAAPRPRWLQKLQFWKRDTAALSLDKMRESAISAREGVAIWADSVRTNADKRTISFALVIMVVVLCVGVYVYYSKNSEAHRVEVFQDDFATLKAQVARAESRILYDNTGAISLLNTASQEADRLLAMGISVPSVEAVQKQIQKNLDKAYGVQRVDLSKAEIADIATAKNDAEPLGLVKIDNSLHAFDKNTWYTVTLDKVSMATVATDTEIQTGLYFPDQEATVFLTKDQRLIEWSGTQAHFMKTDDDTWHDAVSIGDYSRYLYFLDPERNQIWKYGRGADGYSKATEYNKDTDLGQASSVAIDGDIYVATLGGDIKQIFRGKKTDWVPTLPEGVSIEKPVRIRTSLEGKSVYVQDTKNRVLKFQKKDGVYLGQYVFGAEEEITDFLIDDENMKIFALVGTKIYMTPIVI